MSGKLPVKEVEALLRAGMKQTEVVEFLASHRGISVTQGAISQAISAGRIKVDTKVSTGSIPWKLLPEHRHMHPAKMLRTQARLDKGLPVGPSLARQCHAWRAALEADGVVVHYDPETDEGFHRVPRRPGIDQWWVREPDVDDRGQPVQRTLRAAR